MKELTTKIILDKKTEYFEKIKKKAADNNSPKLYYDAVKLLTDGEKPETWDVRSLFPGKSDIEIGEICADYFNGISAEFDSATTEDIPPDLPDTGQQVITRDMIARRLRDCKKVTAGVTGDVMPHLVKKYPDLFADPLERIFDMATRLREWPIPWQLETVTLIPKKSTPTKLSECRNLSCTAFFSKVFEFFILERLKKEVPILLSLIHI